MDFLSAIRRDSDLFYATAQDADPTRPVPSCPEWTIADLVWHLGRVHWFWASDIELRATGPDEVKKDEPARPEDYGDLVAWGRLQVDSLITQLTATADDVVVWTWALEEADHSVGFIRRHQAQEAAIHRWDMQTAAGTADPLDAEVAADAIAEVLDVNLPSEVAPDKPLPGSVHLHCTDINGEWMIHTDGRVEPIHGKGDAAIRGTASDILLAMYDRIPVEQLDIFGDATLARELITRIDTA